MLEGALGKNETLRFRGPNQRGRQGQNGGGPAPPMKFYFRPDEVQREQSPKRRHNATSQNGETTLVCILPAPARLQGVSRAAGPHCSPSSVELELLGVEGCSADPEGLTPPPSPSGTHSVHPHLRVVAQNVILV